MITFNPHKISEYKQIERANTASLVSFKGLDDIKHTRQLKGNVSRKDLANLMNYQLMEIKPKDVAAIVESFPVGDRQNAMMVLDGISQFATLKSLKTVCDYLKSNDDDRLVTFNATDLAANINYLEYKDHLRDTLGSDNVIEEYVDKSEGFWEETLFKSNDIIIADEVFLESLKKSKNLLKKVRKFKGTIIYPQSWINGINICNQSSIKDMQKMTANMLDKVKKVAKQNNLSHQEALEIVLSQPVKEVFKKLKIKKPFTVIKGSLASKLTYEGIAEKFALPKIKPKNIPFNKYLNKMVAAESEIYSPQRMSRIIKRQYGVIKDFAAKKGIKEDNIYFYIPENYKSFGLVSMFYRKIHNIPAERFLDDMDKINKLPSNTMLVMVDDIAGSGESIHDELEHIVTYQGKMVAAPILSTTKAKERLERFPGLTCIPAKIIDVLDKMPYIKNLSKEEQRAVIKKLATYSDERKSNRIKGYAGNGSNVVFPHMAPDNDNAYFFNILSEHFLKQE